jgi:hypothetical protein
MSTDPSSPADGPGGESAPADYETITGEFTPSTDSRAELGDGDVLSNLLIDAGGAKVEIRATTSNWSIRNIGLSGASNTDSRLIAAHVPDSNGAGVIDNVYIEAANNSTNGIFVNASHAGHLDFSNSYVTGAEDTIYGSPPSNPDTQEWVDGTSKDRGQGGTIRAENVYMSDILDYGIRLGVGSAVNVRANNVGVAFASLYREATFEGVHAANSDPTLRVGSPVDNNREYTPNQVVANLQGDVQFEGGEDNFDIRSGGGGPGVVNGTPGSSPSTDVQSGIPTSAQAAAEGTSSASPTPADDGSTSADGARTSSSPGGGGVTTGDGACEFVQSGAYGGGGGGGGGGDGTGGGGDGTDGGGGDDIGGQMPDVQGIIGGGEGYPQDIAEADADTVVTTESELRDAGANATSGETIWIGADITELGNEPIVFDVPVTVASGRSSGTGGIIQGTGDPDGILVFEGDGSLAVGLTVEGPAPNSDTRTESGPESAGLTFRNGGNNGVVENCEIYGFAYKAVTFDADGCQCRHSYIHNNTRRLGYGVDTNSQTQGGTNYVRYNYFNLNRHSVNGAQGSKNTYVVEHNHFGPRLTDHQVDQHEDNHEKGTVSGFKHRIANNTFEPIDQDQHIVFRGTEGPASGESVITKNWFKEDDRSLIRQSTGGTNDVKEVLYEGDTKQWNGVTLSENHWGSNPPAGVGAQSDDSGNFV